MSSWFSQYCLCWIGNGSRASWTIGRLTARNSALHKILKLLEWYVNVYVISFWTDLWALRCLVWFRVWAVFQSKASCKLNDQWIRDGRKHVNLDSMLAPIWALWLCLRIEKWLVCCSHPEVQRCRPLVGWHKIVSRILVFLLVNRTSESQIRLLKRYWGRPSRT